MTKITCEEMRAMDRFAIEEIGIPSIVLMETAALKVVQNIDLSTTHFFTIICAPGNNGGDGLAIARQLLIKDKKVQIFILGDPNKCTTDFQINHKILKNLNAEIHYLTENTKLHTLIQALKTNQLTIDAIFGIGLDRPVTGFFAKIIEQINQHSKQTLAVDLPSGINGDTGEALGTAIHANKTICFHLPQKGLANHAPHIGELIVEDIGIPEIATQTILAQRKN